MLDAIGLAVTCALIPDLVATRAGFILEPHPGWIAVLVLAARYGSGGCLAGLTAAVGLVGIASVVSGLGLTTLWNRLDSGPNLIAFGACLAVSWVASWHLGRQAELGDRVAALTERVAEARETTAALRGVVVALRGRVDRTSASLSFLREVAARLEGTDPVAAAEAATDLALARTGACAAAVHVAGTLFLAARDARGPQALAPLALRDADLTVAIRDGNEEVGVLALWGLPPSRRDEATTHDLAVIAAWCAPTVAIAAWRPEAVAAREQRVG